MVPEAREDKVKEQNLYDYSIKFTLMGKEFSFNIRVDNKRRTE